MSRANKTLAKRLYEEVFGRGNLAAADEIMADGCLNHGPGAPPTVGTEQIKQQAAILRTAIPDLQAILNDQVAEDDRVASRWAGRGTHTGPMMTPAGPVLPTGQPICWRWSSDGRSRAIDI